MLDAMRISPLFAALSVLALVAACGGSEPRPATAVDTSTSKGATTAGTCPGSSMVTTTSCAPRTLPPSNATSDYGCKSDADCKEGRDGRCVSNTTGVYGSATPFVRSPLLAGPPPPPPKTVCTYDRCMANSECGAKARCACGDGTGRNSCVPLDACRIDGDCGKDSLCTCGTNGAANTCIFANCRTDADCDGRGCGQGHSGAYCHTSNDACKTDDDCKKGGDYAVCDYFRDGAAWKCRVIPPLPPG